MKKSQPAPKYYNKINQFIAEKNDEELFWSLKCLAQNEKSVSNYVGHALRLKDSAILVKFLEHGVVKDIQSLMEYSANAGLLSVVRECIKKGAKPLQKSSLALRWASTYGHLDVVEFLLPQSNPNVFNGNPLLVSLSHGHPDVFDILYPQTDVEEMKKGIKGNEGLSERFALYERRAKAKLDDNLLTDACIENSKNGAPKKSLKM